MRRIRLSLTAALVGLIGAMFAPAAVAGNFDEEKMGCAGEAPATCPPATVGQPYSMTIYLTPPDGGRGEDFVCARFHVSSGSFPPGLSISGDGVVSGTPTQAGRYEFFLTVTYDKFPTCAFKNASDDTFLLIVNGGTSAPPPPSQPPPPPPPPAPPTVAITTSSLPEANINQAYTSPPLTATGATVSSWTLVGGALPAGLTLGANGVVSGTPRQSGSFTFNVQANASGTSATKELSVFVLAPLALRTLAAKAPPARGLTAKRLVNTPLVTGATAIGGRAPYTFSTVGDLPPGITLDPATGMITGSGTTAGSYTFTETVTDVTGTRVSVPWTVTVVPLLHFANANPLPPGRVGKRYSARIPVSGNGAGTAQFTIAGRIPPGLRLEDKGRLTGRLRTPGTYSIRVIAFTEGGAPISKQFTIRVRA